MFRDQVDGMIQVACLEDEDAAELLFGFRERAVGDDDTAMLVAQRHRGAGRLQPFTAREVTVCAELVVVGDAAVHHGLLFAFRDGSERVGINVTEADIFHSGGEWRRLGIETLHQLIDLLARFSTAA